MKRIQALNVTRKRVEQNDHIRDVDLNPGKMRNTNKRILETVSPRDEVKTIIGTYL